MLKVFARFNSMLKANVVISGYFDIGCRHLVYGLDLLTSLESN